MDSFVKNIKLVVLYIPICSNSWLSLAFFFSRIQAWFNVPFATLSCQPGRVQLQAFTLFHVA
jgi:hypothetical protein